MRKAGFRGDFWPSPQHELLLQAALASEERARTAWSLSRSEFDLDVLEHGVFDALPLLYRRLAPDCDEAIVSRLKGIYRKVWYSNQLLLDHLSPALRGLREVDVRALVIGACATAFGYHRELGLRRIQYVEALVRPKDMPRAVSVLRRQGLVLASDESLRRRALVFASVRGHALALHDEVPVDLLLPGAVRTSADSLWRMAEEREIGDAVVWTLAPGDELVLACATGAKAAANPRVDWLVDGVAILSSAGGAVDWERVVSLAVERRITLRVHEALRYLRDVLDAPVPGSLSRSLAAARPARRERTAHRLDSRSSAFLGGLRPTLGVYLRLSDERLPALATGLPSHLRQAWGLSGRWAVLRRVARKVPTALRRVATRRLQAQHPLSLAFARRRRGRYRQPSASSWGR